MIRTQLYYIQRQLSLTKNNRIIDNYRNNLAYFVQNPGVPVGKECTKYSWLRGRDRRFSSSGSYKCDRGLKSGWYRFSEEAGTSMLTSCVESNHCGTKSPGWLVGPHPTIDEGKASRTVCFSQSRYSNNQCCSYSANITVRNCGEFFVYNLGPVPTCNARYCGAM